MIVAVEDVKMRIGDKSSNVKIMTISSYQPGDNDLSIDQWDYNCRCQSAIQEAKKGYLHAKQSVMLLPKMSEIPDLERFLNHLRLQMFMQEKIFQMMILF